jgi:hypothetical protein
MCWQCDEVLRFGNALKLRTLTDDDRKTLDLNPQTAAELEQLRIQIAVHRQRA